MSSSGSESTSTSFIPPYGEEALLQEIAGIAAQLGQQTYQWGQQVYNQVGNVTAANISQFLDSAQQAGGLASSAAQTFENVVTPAYNQLAAEAEQYASQPFIQEQMGQAEAQSMQGSQAARQNLIQQMQSYGINPSSGMYQGLEEAASTGAGAAAAAAGTEAALATKAQQQQLQANAVSAGEQFPGFAVNALNTGVQALTGAENSELGAANTGVNLTDAAAPYLQAAMALKYPPLGTRSQSQSGGINTGKAGQDPASRGSNDPGNIMQYGQPGGATNPYTSNSGSVNPNASNAGGAGSIPNAKILKAGQPAGGDQTGAGTETTTESGPGGAMDMTGSEGATLPTGNEFDWGGISPQTGEAINNAGNTPGMEWQGMPQEGGVDTSGMGGESMPAPDQASQQALQGMADSAPPSPDQGTAGGGYDTGDQGGGSDYGGNPYGGTSTSSSYSGSGTGDFATGGLITQPDISYARGGATTGGFVSKSLSPSRGQNTDDIPANLNAGEFVVPRDVTNWHGQKFFHDLIAKSRKARMQAEQAVGPQYQQHAAQGGQMHHAGRLGTRPGMNMR